MQTVITKRTTVSGRVPTASQLEPGELAVNLVDAKLYTKRTDDTIVLLNPVKAKDVTYYDENGVVEGVKEFNAIVTLSSAGGVFTVNYAHVGFTRILNVQLTGEANGTSLADRRLADIQLNGVSLTSLSGHFMSATSAGLLAAMSLVNADAGKIHIKITGT